MKPHPSLRGHLLFTACLLAALLAGCGVPPRPAEQPLALPTQASTVISKPTHLPTSPATETPLPPTSTSIPPPTPTLTFTPTPEPVSMSIAAMRAGTYPGSDITLEQELTAGSNYRRYYVSYRSEGLKIYALLTIPDGAPPPGGWPAIVFNHGYIPPAQYRTTERYIAYVDWLARAGYIVFRIDYRGNDRSEGQPTGAYYNPGYTVDVLNAVASIKRFPQANPEKIGMWGHSMGGFLTLRAMVISPDIKAGVIWAGVVGTYDDLINRWHPPGFSPAPTPLPGVINWRRVWLDTYGTPQENPDFWNSLAANSYLADLSGPLQLHHDLNDSEVPYAFSQELAGQAQAAGKTVDLYSYPGDDHNLANSFGLAMTRTIAFFDQYLK